MNTCSMPPEVFSGIFCIILVITVISIDRKLLLNDQFRYSGIKGMFKRLFFIVTFIAVIGVADLALQDLIHPIIFEC